MASLGFQNQPAQLEPRPCRIQGGKIPTWLHGVLYRSGPGTFAVKSETDETTKQFSHWFDGLQLIHRFEIDGSQQSVNYSNRGNAQSAGEKFLTNPSGMMFFGRQPVDPCESTFGRLFQVFKSAVGGSGGGDSAFPPNVNVVPTMRFPGKQDSLVVSTDANMLDVLDAKTLVSRGVCSYKSCLDELSGTLAAAHHQIDPVTGTLYNFCHDFGLAQQLKVFGIGGDGTASVLATNRGARLSYIHSFAITERYLVLICQPWIYQPLKIPLSGRLMDALNWRPAEQCRYLIVDRVNGGGLVKECQSQAFFFFHTINAFECKAGENGCTVDSLIIDLCGYDDPTIADSLHLNNLRQSDIKVPRSDLYRIRLPAPGVEDGDSQAVSVSKIPCSDVSVELPQINQRMNGKRYRYFYACAGPHDRRSALFDRIVKVENDGDSSISTTAWLAPDSGVPGEPVFVPDPNGQTEDAGVLLIVVLDQAARQSYLAILNAVDMKEITRAWLDTIVAYNFHGEFMGTK